MRNITKWMLAAAVAAGGVGLTAAPAKAAQVGVYVGPGAEYVPPCPGPGYVWTAGYYNNGFWVPGQWIFNMVANHRDRDDYARHNSFFGDRDDHNRGNARRDDNHRDAGRNSDRGNSGNRGHNNQHDNRGHGR
jgi:hypothetical protein